MANYLRQKARFPVPLVVLEALSEEGSASLLSEVLKRWCGVKRPTDADVEYITTRVTDLILRMTKHESEESAGAISKKGYLGTLTEFLSDKDTWDQVLLMSGFDYTKAEVWYTKVDADIALDALELSIKNRVTACVSDFEAVLFGMGGKYGEGDADMHDMTEGDESALAAFDAIMKGGL